MWPWITIDIHLAQMDRAMTSDRSVTGSIPLKPLKTFQSNIKRAILIFNLKLRHFNHICFTIYLALYACAQYCVNTH